MVSLCFICELPILPHQTWSTWKELGSNLLTAAGTTASPGSYVNNLYHEDCLICSVCGIRLEQNNSNCAKRYGNKVYCPLHFSDISGIGTGGEEFMAKLKDFKRQSLGYAEARRKSSTTLSFPIPVQACPGSPYCSGYPHGIKPTSSYWIECCGTPNFTGPPGSYINQQQQALQQQQQQQQQSSQQLQSSSSSQPQLIIQQASSSTGDFSMGDKSDNPCSSSLLDCKEPKEGENLLLGIPTMIPRSNTSSEGFNVSRLERQDTSKSTNDMCPYGRLQPPTIQVIESQTPMTKDDIELYRKQPNIVITQAHSTSPPPSPPAPPKGEPEPLPSTNQPQSKSEDPYELISFQEEIYEKHYYGKEHWNYFTNDEGLGPVILSLKQESAAGRDQFRILLRTVSYSLHGLVPASSICADRYDREAVVKALGDEAGLKPSLSLGQLPSIPDELIKLDQVFVKSELKVGIIYIKKGQTSEEVILGNREESPRFAEFLEILGDRIRLKGFDKYKGGLDTVHDLTGTESVYTNWKNIEIMFHVSTMLPHEENDPQKLQKKRHIGNDIVCVAFIEADDTPFWPGCIKSHFLHAFIVVRTTPKPLAEDEVRKYSISVVCRDEVSAYKPYLWHESTFEKGPHLRDWLLTKIVNGERASYSAPKFARMQDRTRSQMLEDLVTNLANHLATGQIPKPYRRGSWRPIGHMRPSSPLLDSVRDLFEGYDQLAKDFSSAFNNNAKMICDVAFNVMGNPGNGCHETQIRRIYGVRAILAIRSRVFLEMLYGFSPPGTVNPSSAQMNNPGGSINPTMGGIGSNSLSPLIPGSSSSGVGISSSSSSGIGSSTINPSLTTITGHQPLGPSNSLNKNQSSSPEKPRTTRKSSITASTIHKISQIPKIIHPSESKSKRKESTISNFSNASASKTPTYLTVPGASSLGGSFRAAFSRLVSGSWAGWGSKNRNDSIKRWQSESIYGRTDLNIDPSKIPSLSVCADIAKIDRNKLAQTEFTIIEFDGNTFQLLIEYLHSGSCPLTCDTIPGLICAAEHFDLPDLLQACFHHAKTHLRLSCVPAMLNQLENYYWRYNSATQLVNTILKFVDPRVGKFFSRSEFLTLSETMITNILSRPGLDLTEIQKFQIMYQWAVNKVLNSDPNHPTILVTKENVNNHNLPPTKFTELKAIMSRLTRDVKFHKMAPQDIIKIVLPSKTITHDKILATLLYQADRGLYRDSTKYTQFGS